MQTANLVLHCGANKVEREQVALVATPAPTKTWCPIPHADFIGQVEKALVATNMRVVTEAHALTREGNRYFGLFQISNCQSTGNDYSYVLGLRNSHDQSYPAGLVVGSQVFVCDNLSFSGEIKIARKHTSRIMEDLPRLASQAIGLLAEKWTVMGDRIDNYKAAEITDRDAHDFAIRAIDMGAATLSMIPGILKEWRTPRHPEFAQVKNAWRLFNAFTEIAKESSLMMLPKRTISLHGLMDAQVGFMASCAAEDKVSQGTTDVEVQVTNN